MEQMVHNCGVDSVRLKVIDIMNNILVSDYNENNVSDTVVLLNGILSSIETINNIPEVKDLIDLLTYKGIPNTCIGVLCDEIKLRSIREVSMCNIQVNEGDQKQYREDISFNNRNSSTIIEENGKKKVKPVDGNFTLPEEGTTGIIKNKFVDSKTGKAMIQELVIDSEGNIVKELSSYEDNEGNENGTEIDFDKAYTELMDNVMSYSELSEDDDITSTDISTEENKIDDNGKVDTIEEESVD